MSLVTTIAIDAGVWAGVSVVVGYVGHRLPRQLLDRDTWLTRVRPGERAIYERLQIKRWKDRSPEFGAVFRGGVSKRRVGHDLRRFAAETRRAEYVHWAIAVAGPLFFFWNPWWLGLCMLAYAIGANAPCIAIQRYNRGRASPRVDRPSR